MRLVNRHTEYIFNDNLHNILNGFEKMPKYLINNFFQKRRKEGKGESEKIKNTYLKKKRKPEAKNPFSNFHCQCHSIS